MNTIVITPVFEKRQFVIENKEYEYSYSNVTAEGTPIAGVTGVEHIDVLGTGATIKKIDSNVTFSDISPVTFTDPITTNPVTLNLKRITTV
jgi:hypothetical protein